jgi:phenylacetate-coenzyme A ligase PaaK-like adenylate-forming protein
MIPPEKMIAELERCETMPRRQLREYQRTLLSSVLRRARANVGLYAARLDGLFRPDGAINFDRWPEIPVLTKEDIRQAGDALFDHNIPDSLKPLNWTSTSGTTGKPFLAAKTQFALFISACVNERLFVWGELDPRKPFATIRYSKDQAIAYPDGQTNHGWSRRAPNAVSHTLTQTTTTDQQIDWLRRKRPAYLSAYPSVAAEIGETLGQQASDLGIEAVLTFGEAVLDHQSHAIRELLGARLIDAYSAQEIGFIALQCPVSEDYHIVSGGVLVEIADSEGYPLPPGTEGDILITPFHNPVMPLIRYQIGDRGVMASGRCPCGRTGPRLATIGGRSRDMFHYSDGSHRFANLSTPDLQAAIPCEQFQLVQHSPTDVELIYVLDRAHSVELAPKMEELQRVAHRDLHPSVTIRATRVDHIPRTPAGKFARTVRLF